MKNLYGKFVALFLCLCLGAGLLMPTITHGEPFLDFFDASYGLRPCPQGRANVYILGGAGVAPRSFLLDDVHTHAATIYIEGIVHLTLADDSHWTINHIAGNQPVGGIRVMQNNALHIHAQSTGSATGRLTVQGGHSAAGIGNAFPVGVDPVGSVGTIVINGGHINATGGQNAAGIGGGRIQHNGNITINGGIIQATGGTLGAGIGGGQNGSGGVIQINGGDITATGGLGATGIGSGSATTVQNISAGNLFITGGNISATSGNVATVPGMGGLATFNSGLVVITGGTQTVNGTLLTDANMNTLIGNAIPLPNLRIIPIM